MPSRACLLALSFAALPVALVACSRPEHPTKTQPADPAIASAASGVVAVGAASASGGPTVDGCRAARARTEADFAAAYAQAGRSCTRAEDCELVRIHCGRCGSGAVDKRQLGNYQRAIAPLEASCESEESAACDRLDPQPIPTCAPVRATCEAGRCEARMRLPPK
jgi:hypothetical protein